MKQNLALPKWQGWSHREGTLTAGQRIVYDFPETVDMRPYDCIAIDTESTASSPSKLHVILYPLPSGRPEFMEEVTASIFLPPEGGLLHIPFRMFSHSTLVCAHMKYISGIELRLENDNPEAADPAELLIKCISLSKEGDFHATLPFPSKAGAAGEKLTWEVILENESEKTRYITAAERRNGRESIPLDYPSKIVLAPMESLTVTVRAEVPDSLPENGFEARTLEWLPDGDGLKCQSTTLYAARKCPHPFLIHTTAGWERLRERLAEDASLRSDFDAAYGQPAADWEVPAPYSGRQYVYDSTCQDDFLKTAIAWQVTQEQSLLEKLLAFFNGFLDEEKGYLATEYSYFQAIRSRKEYEKGTFPVRHMCSAGWVQEGEFMTKVAKAYDLLHDRPEFTPAMHEAMERCMRNYMDFVSWRLTDGDGNNFQISEASAGLYFACLLQDYPMIHRFLEGSNGLYELIGSVLSDDGSYFEGASNYMKLAADMLSHAAIACENFGLNLKDRIVPASHDKYVIHAPWATRGSADSAIPPFLGMSFERAVPTRKPTRRLKSLYDNLLRLLTPEGILFSANDSNEKNLVQTMELAYYLYRDEDYLQIAGLEGHRDILYGRHMLENASYEAGRRSHLNTGNGFAVLREQADGCSQAVMKFGQHGGYHGHYDRLSLVSLIKDNRTFHNMEFTWYGYASFLFKMWVHSSLAHNMVVADRRMQEPSACECILFTDTDRYQAVCAQTVSRWSDPPYGGQTPYLQSFPDEKCAREGRYVLTPEEAREQGDIGTYSEPVFQRRLMILAEGCCYVWDYEEAAHSHSFDCFYHPFGSVSAEGLRQTGHTDYLDEDPYGAAQFIRDCHWYAAEGTVKLSFENNQERVNHNDIIDFTKYSDLYGIYPQGGQVMVGRYPRQSDTFAAGENCQSENLLADPCKKAVAFHQEGTSAKFITALETGMAPGKIRDITCSSYERIEICMQDGTKRELCVQGMDRRTERDITVTYHRL